MCSAEHWTDSDTARTVTWCCWYTVSLMKPLTVHTESLSVVSTETIPTRAINNTVATPDCIRISIRWQTASRWRCTTLTRSSGAAGATNLAPAACYRVRMSCC